MNEIYLELLTARSRLWGLYRSWYVPAETRRRILRDIADIQQKSGLSLETIFAHTGLDATKYQKWQLKAAESEARHTQLLGIADRWTDFLSRPLVQLATSILVGVAVLLCIWYVDYPVASYFYTLRETSLYETFVNISYLGESSFYILFLSFIWWVTRRRDTRTAAMSLFILLSVLYSGILVNALKLAFGRARPEVFLNEAITGFSFFNLDWSDLMQQTLAFPSGHSATAASLGLAFSLLFPRYRWIFALVAITIASSRVVVFMHYPADVLAGGLVGILVPIWLYRRMFRTPHGRDLILNP